MRPEKFTCHREGLKIRGKVYRNSEEPKPAVILSHGFLANSDMCRTYARTVIDKDIYDEISGFADPVLYIHGTKDEIVDISYAKKAHCCFPDCEYHEIEGAGHGFKGEDDQRACGLIREFMK